MGLEVVNILVINLDRQTERIVPIASQLKQLGLSWERISAVDGQRMVREIPIVAGWKLPGYDLTKRLALLACARSHVFALNKAKEAGWSQVLILEDDVILPVGFENLLSVYMDCVPEDWRVLRLGGWPSPTGKTVQVSPLWWTATKFYQTYAYITREYDALIALWEEEDGALDQTWWGFEGAYHCVPILVAAAKGFYSAIELKKNYNIMSRKRLKREWPDGFPGLVAT